jgi:hypothetical protein
MTLVEWILLVVGVLAVVGLAALIVLAVAVGLARRPDRASVAVIDPDGLDEYFDRGAAFAVTVVERTPLSASEVFGRLAGRPYLSSLPFLQGPDWLVSPTSGGVGVGARRTMSGTIYSVSEQVICYEQDSQIALTGTAVCTPATIRCFAERFTISPADRSGVTEVTWTVAGTPAWVGFLPWRWGAPLVAPVLAFVLRHMLRLGTFRVPRAAG